MITQKKFFILGVCLLSIIIYTVSAAMPGWEEPGSISPNPPISMDDPYQGPGHNLIWPDPGNQSSPGYRGIAPDERISNPEPVNTPINPDNENNPEFRIKPITGDRSTAPDERISNPEPVNIPINPYNENNPEFGIKPITGDRSTAPDERISNPKPVNTPLNPDKGNNPDFGTQPISGDQKTAPDERISNPEPVNTPLNPDKGNNPDFEVEPITGNRKQAPDERISNPEPVSTPLNPYKERNPSEGFINPVPDERISNPEPINHPSPIVQNPDQDGRISGPEERNPDPCINPGNQPFIPPGPTPEPRSYQPAPYPVRDISHPINHPTGNIYPVYEEPEHRYPCLSPPPRWSEDREFSSCSYYSSHWYRTGSIQIFSTPARAEVYLNNKFRGKTPYSGYLDISYLSPGTYNLLVKYSGYISDSRTVYVERDEVESINVYLTRIEDQVPQETVPQESAIWINSEPAGANVLLDNEYRGITPVTLKNTVVGEHTLILQKGGYNDFVTKLQTVQGQTLPITAVLNAISPVSTPLPVQTPVPSRTYAGLPGGLALIGLVIGSLWIFRQKKK